MKPSTRPEYSVAESVETPPMEKHRSCSDLNFEEVVAELALLSREVTMSVDILERIRESLDRLQQALELR